MGEPLILQVMRRSKIKNHSKSHIVIKDSCIAACIDTYWCIDKLKFKAWKNTLKPGANWSQELECKLGHNSPHCGCLSCFTQMKVNYSNKHTETKQINKSKETKAKTKFNQTWSQLASLRWQVKQCEQCEQSTLCQFLAATWCTQCIVQCARYWCRPLASF